VKYAFHLVDVFTDRPLAGNQLAIVLDADGLETDRMQAIAREFNFSETTFVTASAAEGCDWRVRIFTPVGELPMAGHPTIGTAVVLESLGRASERTVFELGVGPTPVRLRPGWAEMDQRPPTFGRVHPDPAALAEALSIGPEEITETGLPVQSVSTGVPFLMVPVRSLAAMRRLQPRADDLRATLAPFPGSAVYCFAREVEQPGSDAHCRMFAPDHGVAEDPATGSAAGPLGCYLAVHGHTHGDAPLRFRFEQGIEMGRPSLIQVSVEQSAGAITAVRVAGEARPFATGSLTMDPPDENFDFAGSPVEAGA
jgi:trans-2,3-dihydro-3-hydroxyanthranilate isomerase